MRKVSEKLKHNRLKSEGITLIALMITIVVLLILVGVSIATITGEDGFLTKAIEAREKNTEAIEKDEIGAAYNAAVIESEGEEVTAESIRKQLEIGKIEAEVSGENPFKVVIKETGNEYEIKDGEITKKI